MIYTIILIVVSTIYAAVIAAIGMVDLLTAIIILAFTTMFLSLYSISRVNE